MAEIEWLSLLGRVYLAGRNESLYRTKTKMNHRKQIKQCLLVGLTGLLGLQMVACAGKTQSSDGQDSVVQQRIDSLRTSISFDADSAYSYVAQQVSFGARVPGSEAWQACSRWIEDRLRAFGAEVSLQETRVRTFDGKELPCRNIVASFNPEASRRVLLGAHWDSRPFADQDPSEANRSKPVSGADDGASGVGVLLELARQWGRQKPLLGIDIVLFDVEDYGSSNDDESWCLGSTYWAKNPHKPNYSAEYGILLDMVGAKGAKFYQEGFSRDFAPLVVAKIWDKAASLGYGELFVQAGGSYLTDDHLPIQRHRAIRMANIVNYDPARTKGFGDHWHTANDNMEVIDKATLEAVGKTVMAVIDDEQP